MILWLTACVVGAFTAPPTLLRASALETPTTPVKATPPWNAQLPMAQETYKCALASFLTYEFNGMKHGTVIENPRYLRDMLKEETFGVAGNEEAEERIQQAYEEMIAFDPETRLLYFMQNDRATLFGIFDVPRLNLIITVFRGTNPLEPVNVWDDLNIQKVPWDLGGKIRHVHSGYYWAFEDVRDEIDFVHERIYKNYPDRNILVTGHSLGGALATICGAHFAQTYPEKQVKVVNFGSPRVGNRAFKNYIEKEATNLQHTRIINHRDIVPRMFLINYHHVGHLIYFPDLLDENATDYTPKAFLWGKKAPWNMYTPYPYLSVLEHLKYTAPAKAWFTAATA